jgi:hypothetical protein
LIATAVLCGKYFFILPASFSTIAATSVLLAWLSLRKEVAA